MMQKTHTINAITALVEKEIKNFPEILFITLFGSAAKGQLKDSSDIDLGLAAQYPISFERRITLSTALSNLLGRNVDIIDLHSVSGVILQQALCTGIIIKNSPLLYAALLKKMWFNQADMMPYTRRVLEHHCRRFINE